jgi:hypothetical protein
MKIFIRTRIMHLMSDRAYACAYGRLYIYRPLALEIDQLRQSTSQRSIQSNKRRAKCTTANFVGTLSLLPVT